MSIAPRGTIVPAMRAWPALLIVCSSLACSSTSRPPSRHAADAPTQLVPFARLLHPAVLVKTRDRVALSFSTVDAWTWLDERGSHEDPALAQELARIAQAIGGDSIRLFVGRTPLVAGTDPSHSALGRPRDAALIAPPGVVVDALPLGDGEIWLSRAGGRSQMALVSRAGERRLLAGEVHAIASAGSAVAALIAEGASELRVETLQPDGTSTERRLAPLTTIGFDAGDYDFAIGPDGAPVLAGIRGGRLAIARARADGTWIVTPSSIAMITFAARMAVDARGAAWTNTLGRGADGHDQYLLARDGIVVPLTDPDGQPLSTHDFVVDERLGVVAIASARGQPDAPRWLLAQRPPRGAMRELPGPVATRAPLLPPANGCQRALVALADGKLDAWTGTAACTRADVDRVLGYAGQPDAPGPFGVQRICPPRGVSPYEIEVAFPRGEDGVTAILIAYPRLPAAVEARLGAPEATLASGLGPDIEQRVWAHRGLAMHIQRGATGDGRIVTLVAFAPMSVAEYEAHTFATALQSYEAAAVHYSDRID